MNKLNDMQTDPTYEKTIQRIKYAEEIVNTVVYYFAAYMVFIYWLDMAFWVVFPTCILCFIFSVAMKKVEKPFVEWLVKPFVKKNGNPKDIAYTDSDQPRNK